MTAASAVPAIIELADNAMLPADQSALLSSAASSWWW
jgi:hypothetical protein